MNAAPARNTDAAKHHSLAADLAAELAGSCVDELTRLLSRTRHVGDCRLWAGARSDGYAITHVPGSKPTRRVKDLVFELTRGLKPRGAYIRLRCNDRLCIAPEHVYASTASETQRESYAARRGDAPRPAKATRKPVTQATRLTKKHSENVLTDAWMYRRQAKPKVVQAPPGYVRCSKAPPGESHRWQIAPFGAELPATCKHCGAERVFRLPDEPEYGRLAS